MAGNVVSNVKKYYGGQVPVPGQGDSDGKVKLLVEKTATVEIGGVQTEVELLFDSDDLTTPVTPQQLGQWTDENYLIAFKKREDDGRVRGFILYALETDSTSTDTLVNRATFVNFKEDMNDPGASAYVFEIVEDSSTLTRYLRDSDGELIVKFNQATVEAGAQSGTLHELIDTDTSALYFEVVHEDGKSYLRLNTEGLGGILDDMNTDIGYIIGALDELPSDEHGYFNSSLYTTPGDGTTTNLVMDDFRIAEGRDVSGENIEFVPTHQEGGVDFGEVYLEPGTYILAIQYTLQWVGNPRGTFLPKVCSVADQPFDFSYEHEDTVHVTRIVTRTTSGKLVTNIAIDADTPSMGVLVKNMEVVQVATFNHSAVVHDTTITGKGQLGDPLGVTPAAFGKIKDIPTSISQFRTGDVIPVDGPNGPAKMAKDDLFKETAQNALAGNVVPAFVPNSTTTVAGLSYMYDGSLYMAKEAYQGPWKASKFKLCTSSDIARVCSIKVNSALDSGSFNVQGVNRQGVINYLDLEDPDVVHGYYINMAGNWVTQTTNYLDILRGGQYGESGFIPVVPGETLYFYSAKFGAVDNVAYFDENRNRISLHAQVRSMTVPYNACYVRTPINSYNALHGIDANNMITREPIIENTYIPFSRNSDDIKYVRSATHDRELGGPVNLYNPDDADVETGGYRNGFDNSWVVNSSYTESGFIPITDGNVVTYYRERAGYEPTEYGQLQYCLYAPDKSYVTGGITSVSPHKTTYIAINPTDNIKYIRLPVNVTQTGKVCVGTRKLFTKYIPYGIRKIVLASDVRKELGESDNPISQKAVTDALNTIPQANQWSGKKWYAYGTSITNTSAEGKYATYLAQMSGMLHTNKGISGGGIGNLGAYSQGQVFNAICNTTDGKLEADLITLETGANDVNANVPLGTIYDDTQATLAGCLTLCIRYLQEHTDAQIAIMPSVATKAKPNEANQYYKWQLMMEQICTINRVYFIRPACNLGYGKINSSKGSLYVVDSIHQTNLGGYILAEAIWKQIKEIPLFRTSLPST